MKLKLRLKLTMLCGAILVGCAAPKQQHLGPPTDYVPLERISIKPAFEPVLLTRENLVTEIKRCVPFIQPNTQRMDDPIYGFPNNNAVNSRGHRATSKQFIYRGTKGLCLEFSANQYPIFALETFLGTVNPVGLPSSVTDDWFTKIALKVAVDGRAKVAFLSGKSNAFIATYWVEKPGSHHLHYSSEFKKYGEWENINVDYKFSNPGLNAVSEALRGNPRQRIKYFPGAGG